MRKVMACLVALVATAVTANAAPIFTVTNNTSGNVLGNPPFTLGFQFAVGSTPKLLASLGVFDSGRDGLATSHAIGIWNSAGTLLASGVVPAGTAGRLENQFRYIDITPITLLAGQTYTIGALYDTGTEPLLFPGDATGFATDPSITFLQSRFAGGPTLTNPTGSVGTLPAYFGPNGIIAAVPEPLSVLVFGGLLAAGGLAVRRRVTATA